MMYAILIKPFSLVAPSDRRTSSELVDAESAEEAARIAINHCSVLQIRQGIEVTVYEVAERETWRFQYKYPHAPLFPRPGEDDVGEIVGIQTGRK